MNRKVSFNIIQPRAVIMRDYQKKDLCLPILTGKPSIKIQDKIYKNAKTGARILTRRTN